MPGVLYRTRLYKKHVSANGQASRDRFASFLRPDIGTCSCKAIILLALEW